jgi:hypothetical protein
VVKLLSSNADVSCRVGILPTMAMCPSPKIMIEAKYTATIIFYEGSGFIAVGRKPTLRP